MRTIVAIAASSLALACGAQAAPPNACGLLTDAELTRVLGSGATAMGGRFGPTSSCFWSRAGGPAEGIVSIELREGMAQGTFVHNALTTPGAVVLHGIGDRAFRVRTVLWVYAGRYRLVLTSARLPAPLAVETQIARLAVRRL